MQDALFGSCLKRKLLTFGATVFCLLVSDVVVANTSQMTRGSRYCEVIFFNGREVSVYDTLYLNECPHALWKGVSTQEIKSDTKSYFVYLNGPRRFTVDIVKQHHLVEPKPKIFNRLEMHKVGVVHPSLREIMFGAAAYHEHHVERHTTWTYAAGKQIYELIDPLGQVYVMQSFAILATQQTEQDLRALEYRLQLPKKWRFKTGILQKDTQLNTLNNDSVVIQDDLRNTYQKAQHDLL